jgi:hypothetical protein
MGGITFKTGMYFWMPVETCHSALARCNPAAIRQYDAFITVYTGEMGFGGREATRK